MGRGDMVRKAEKTKGLPMWALGIPLVVLVAALFFVPRLLGAGVSKVADTASKAVTGTSQHLATVLVKTNSVAAVPRFDQVHQVPAAGLVVKEKLITGFLYKPGPGKPFYLVMFDDGSVRSTRDRDFGGFLTAGPGGGKIGCVLGGEKFYVKNERSK